MRDEKEGRKKQAGHNKGKQHNTPEAVTFLKKNELPRMGFEHMTLRTLDRMLYHLHVECRWFESHPRQLIFLRKSDCLECAVLLCLVVCLTLLASLFLPSHLSLKHVHVAVCNIIFHISML